MPLSLGQGYFLGGVAQGREIESRRRAREARIANEKRTLDMRQQEMDFVRHQEAVDSTRKAIDAAITTFVDAKQSFDGTTDEFLSRYGNEIGTTLNALESTAANVGLPAPQIRNRVMMQIRSTPTASELAQAEGRATVKGMSATADALETEAGFTPQQAKSAAFGLKAPETHSFMTPDELKSAGLPPDSVVQINNTTGEANVIREGGKGLPSRADAVTIENTLRDELDKQSEDFEEQQRAFNTMQQLSQDASGASDVALVFSFFKSIDPQSTVREGEFATAATAMGLGEQLSQVFRKVDNGEILSPELRKGLVDAARRPFVQSVMDQRDRQEFYRGLAVRAGVDPTNVLRNRIRSSAEFVTMTDAELGGVDLSNLTPEQVREYEAELSRRGY